MQTRLIFLSKLKRQCTRIYYMGLLNGFPAFDVHAYWDIMVRNPSTCTVLWYFPEISILARPFFQFGKGILHVWTLTHAGGGGCRGGGFIIVRP